MVSPRLVGVFGLLTLAVLAAAPPGPAAPPERKVEFNRDIRPILADKCFACHGPDEKKLKAKLRLDLPESARKMGDDGRAPIVPGKPEASELIRRIEATEASELMPPPKSNKNLTPPEKQLLRRWIAQGGEYEKHWSFIPPARQPLPTVHDAAWPKNAIDYFILTRLEKEGLSASPEADRATLIRRLSLDLLGLVPSPQDVEDFLHDSSPNAYEKLVDRLLASPHYGERQARHWLDLARYADSNGYTIDGPRSIWPWRDWVIAAYNGDMPFDEFTIEQLAGDLLPNATRAQRVATGFQRNTAFNEEGGTNPEQFRVERTVDRTNTVGAVWLGLTVGCAQCHSHKYDPISHKEYYQLYAFFNSLDEPKLSLPTAEQEQQLKELRAELDRAKKEPPAPKRTPEELKALLAELDKETNGGWWTLYPKMLSTEPGTTLSALEDRSVLASGQEGAAEYVVQSVAPESGTVTAIRLEALKHPSLPQHGPGRAKNGNFILNQLVFETDGVPHKFRKAVADHSQPKYDVNDVLKDEPGKGWAINADDAKERNVDRQAIFFLDRPHPVREGQAFTFTLRFAQGNKGYSLGRFRLAVTFASEKVLELPLSAQQIVFMDPAKRETKDLERLQQALLAVPANLEQQARLQKEIQKVEGRVATTLGLNEAGKPRETHIHLRGDYLVHGEAVQPATFAVLPGLGEHGGLTPGRSPNRLDLAHWLVSGNNPLTGRVLVNRLWQHYFSKGLVETENDFGLQGALPTHPELLDWLATEVVRQRWSLKQMHRLLVTSATYRQASHVRRDLAEKDPQNRLLGRQHRLRLEAEVIRDAALSASGLLTGRFGGPGVYPPQPPEIFAFTQSKHPWPESKGPDRYRRGMYMFIWRQSQHPLLTTFDAPDAQVACTRRNRSNTPLQALHLANDPTFVEIAKGLADRVEREGPSDKVGRLRFTFRLCFSRLPTEAEQARLLQYLEQQRQADESQAWTLLARVLLNLDEFITRE